MYQTPNGKRLGRRPALTPEQVEAIQTLAAGPKGCSYAQLARMYRVSERVIADVVRKHGAYRG